MQRKGPRDRHLRENYEDHSHRFLDWSHRFGIERWFLGRLFLRIEERFLLRRFSFVFLFCLILAAVLTFEVRTPMNFQVGDIAKNDVYSPVSFEMVDEITTEEKRMRAEMSVPLIFDFDPTVFERVSASVYRSFRLMRNNMKSIKWPRSLNEQEEIVKEFIVHKGEFEKELGVNVSDYTFEWLVRSRFSARLENLIIRNLETWYQDKFAENVDKVIPMKVGVILARTVQKNNHGREFSLRRQEILDTSEPEMFALRDMRGLEKFSRTDVSTLLGLSRLLIYPNLTLNKQEMESRRSSARASVLATSISVKKNQVLIAEGTTIQPFHMAIIREIEVRRSESRRDLMTLALAFLFLAIILIFFSYLRRFTLGRVKVDGKDILVMGLITLGTVFFTKIFLFFTSTALISKFGGHLPSDIFLYASPVAAGPILVGLLITSGEVVWLFSALMAIVIGIMSEFNLGIMIFTLAGGIAGARGVFGAKKRSDLYLAGMRAGLVNAFIATMTVIITRIESPNFLSILAAAGPAGLIGGLLSSFVAMTLIPLLETMFNYTTDVKLLELSNLNHPLLRDMIVKAPGTYHHSMLVGSMVESAAEEIGANSLLGKVMCYYHDIGKMEHANYFIENQKPGQNPHDQISPYMSKTLLVAHVKDGVELGMNHKLGKPIIDGILQHHGTTLISYFYNKAIDMKGENGPDVVEDEFRYPGPKPQFREAALCMLADSIEAAARSLDEPTPVRLQNIVRNIVQRKFMEGQLDECSLTLKDLSKVESAFTRILLGIYHQRIDYPRSAGGGTSEAPVTPLFSKGRPGS